MTTRWIEAAGRIGARLARDAIWHERRCNWYAPHQDSFSGGQEESLCTLGPTVYDGTAGIALFLARLAQATDDAVLAAVARGAAEHALSRVCDVLSPMRQGFHTGAIGIGYAAVMVGQCCSDETLVSRGTAVALDALGTVDAAMTDVISGLAGAVPAALRLFEATGEMRLRDAALRAGEAILDRGVESVRGLSWDTMGEMSRAMEAAGLGGHIAAPAGGPHLTGLSHGAGGVAVALLEIGASTGDSRFGEAARRAFAYEDSWFDEAGDGWPDLREGPNRGSAVSAWCHGAAGIGLARLRAFQLTREDRFRAGVLRSLRIAGRAIRGRLAQGRANYSLCHGLAGDAELFRLAAIAFADPEVGSLARQVALHGLETYADEGLPWPSGAPDGAETPGLMLGLAGTGYFYLAMGEGSRVPPILLVDAEITAS